MKRPNYDEAIAWLANNDDNTWLQDEYGSISVTASLVADMFGVADTRVKRDLRIALEDKARNVTRTFREYTAPIHVAKDVDLLRQAFANMIIPIRIKEEQSGNIKIVQLKNREKPEQIFKHTDFSGGGFEVYDPHKKGDA